MFLGVYRSAFLEYLRNLTPQILFLTTALVAFAPLDMTRVRPDWEGLKNLFGAALCSVVFVGAFVASISKFLDDVVRSTAALDIEIKRLQRRHESRAQLLRAVLKAAWALNRSAFIQMAIAAIVVQASGIAITMMAAKTAISVLRGS